MPPKAQDLVTLQARIPRHLAEHVETQMKLSRIKKSDVLRDALELYVRLSCFGYDLRESSVIREEHRRTAEKSRARD